MAAILEHARTLDRLSLSHVQVRQLINELRKSGLTPQVRIAFAGNVTFEPLPEFLLAHLACDGIPASSCSVPFGQLMQELLAPDSALRRFDPTFLHLHFEIEPLLCGARDRRAFDTTEQRRAALQEIVELMTSTVHEALRATRAVILLSNFVGPPSCTLGLADFRAELGEQELFAELNRAIAKAFCAEGRVQIVDLASLTAEHGRSRARDRRLFYMSKVPWHESFFPPLADELARHVKVSLGHVRKCLVVDLDNTLWEGVLGEDGPMGVRAGVGDPSGEAHLDLQRKILALKQRGLLLAVCSKNNPQDVDELFRLRPDMPLQATDFACMEIGWHPKNEGLQRIAATLNIGTDSLVFLDDNPAEIALIRQLMPEVECVLVPADSSVRATCLDGVHSLDRAVITAEDLAKSRQYAEGASRAASRAMFADLQGYLRSLETRVAIRPMSRDLMTRAHQLFTKTNQFNATTRRYTLAELEQIIADPRCDLLMVHARDRFGDLGWIGAVVLRACADSVCHVENFVLSCRALGRGVEVAVMNHVKRCCFVRSAYEAISAEYRVGKKNVQVATLFDSQGFETREAGPDGGKRYLLLRESCVLAPCDWIDVEAEYA